MPYRPRSPFEDYLLSLASDEYRIKVAKSDEHESAVETARLEAERLAVESKARDAELKLARGLESSGAWQDDDEPLVGLSRATSFAPGRKTAAGAVRHRRAVLRNDDDRPAEDDIPDPPPPRPPPPQLLKTPSVVLARVPSRFTSSLSMMAARSVTETTLPGAGHPAALGAETETLPPPPPPTPPVPPPKDPILFWYDFVAELGRSAFSAVYQVSPRHGMPGHDAGTRRGSTSGGGAALSWTSSSHRAASAAAAARLSQQLCGTFYGPGLADPASLACKSVRKYCLEDGAKEHQEKEDLASIRVEVAIMARLGAAPSPHIVALRDVHESERHVHIVMDLVPGPTLQAYLSESGALPEPTAARLFQGAALAVQRCHQLGVMHRDVRPANLVMTSPDAGRALLRLTDFSSAAFYDHNKRLRDAVGEVDWCAPEAIDRGGGYGPEIDNWALGVILHQLLSGELPFRSDDGRPGTTAANVVRRSVTCSSPAWARVSDQAKRLVQRLLMKDIKNRVALDDVLCDPWVTSGGRGGPEPGDAGRGGDPDATSHAGTHNGPGTPVRAGKPKREGAAPVKSLGPGVMSTPKVPRAKPRGVGLTKAGESMDQWAAMVQLQQRYQMFIAGGDGNLKVDAIVNQIAPRGRAPAAPSRRRRKKKEVLGTGDPHDHEPEAPREDDADGGDAGDPPPGAEPGHDGGHDSVVDGDSALDEGVTPLYAIPAVLVPPSDPKLRARIGAFVDVFNVSVQTAYVRTLEASTKPLLLEAAESLFDGLTKVDCALQNFGAPGGPFLLGRMPSLAEASTAPSALSMLAALRPLRGVDLVRICRLRGCERIAQWMEAVEADPVGTCGGPLPTPLHCERLARKMFLGSDFKIEI